MQQRLSKNRTTVLVNIRSAPTNDAPYLGSWLFNDTHDIMMYPLTKKHEYVCGVSHI